MTVKAVWGYKEFNPDIQKKMQAKPAFQPVLFLSISAESDRFQPCKSKAGQS